MSVSSCVLALVVAANEIDNNSCLPAEGRTHDVLQLISAVTLVPNRKVRLN